MARQRVDSLSDLSDDALECRVSHLFVTIGDTDLLEGKGGRLIAFTRWRRCTRCFSIKKWRIDATKWDIISSSYEYDEDSYPILSGYRPHLGDLMQEQFRRSGVLPMASVTPIETPRTARRRGPRAGKNR